MLSVGTDGVHVTNVEVKNNEDLVTRVAWTGKLYAAKAVYIRESKNRINIWTFTLSRISYWDLDFKLSLW